jgi:hypothetical protein
MNKIEFLIFWLCIIGCLIIIYIYYCILGIRKKWIESDNVTHIRVEPVKNNLII